MSKEDESNIDDAIAEGDEVEEIVAEAPAEEEVTEIEESEEEAPPAHMIPKSRYDSAQKRARMAEAKVKQYEADQAALAAQQNSTSTAVNSADSQLEELDRSIVQAQLDGDTDKVVELSKRARSLEKDIYQQMAETAAANAGTRAQESVKLDSLIDILEDQYDSLNPDSDNFDEDKINEILDMQKAFVKNGESPSAAMLKAVGYIMPEQRVTDEVSNKRRTNVAKNLKAASAQAPSTTDIGANSNAAGKTDSGLDLSQMTMEEFDALPPETIKRLRGDAI
jgi:hypothetical protein